MLLDAVNEVNAADGALLARYERQCLQLIYCTDKYYI